MNSETKHTPGPWLDGIYHAKRDGGRTLAFITKPDRLVPVAVVDLGPDGYGREEGEANARLIAAAPDLFEAVKATRALVVEGALTGFNCHDGDWAERLYANQARLSAALSKAGG